MGKVGMIALKSIFPILALMFITFSFIGYVVFLGGFGSSLNRGSLRSFPCEQSRGTFNTPDFFAYYCYIAVGPFMYLSCLLRVLLSITKIGRTIMMIITLLLISVFTAVGGYNTTELGVAIRDPKVPTVAPLAAMFAGMFLSQLFIVVTACIFVCIDTTEPEKEVQ